MSSLDVLKNLQNRVTALEQQLGDTPGADSLQPNVITVNPDSTIGASFTGHVHAEGLDLDAGTSTTPPDQDRVRWLRTSDGAVIADLSSYSSGGTDSLTLQAHALTGSSVAALVGKDDSGGNTALLEAIGGAGGALVLAEAGTNQVTLIDGNGLSNFLKLAQGAASRKIDHGTKTANVPAGWSTVALAFNFAFTGSPDFVYSILGAGASITGTEYNFLTGSGVNIDINSAVAQTIKIGWLAIGG